MNEDLGFVPALADALRAADYTYATVAGLIGPTAHAALSRNETLPAQRATRGGTPAETLTRLWLLQVPVGLADAERALPGLVDRLCAAGVLERSVSQVAARVDVRPYAAEAGADRTDLWVASDLTPGLDGGPNRVGPDHVLGISPAATTLAQLTVRDPVDSALDLGTGCGVQSLHLAAHARRVVATDVNLRALWPTRLNAALNEVPGIDVRAGTFFEPVRSERFDLVVSNPPFVISPGSGERLVYRDSGLPGDRVVEYLVRRVPDHLTESGTCQLLANWMVLRDQPWDERLAGWVRDGAAETGAACDAWVLQRETCDLPTYVELWLKDAGAHPSTGGDPTEYRRRYDTWLSWFEEQGAEAVGMGWVNLRRTGAATGAEPDVRLEDWPYEVSLPLGEEVAAHFGRASWLREVDDAALLDTRLVAPADVIQESVGEPGAADPAVLVLRRQVGVRRARQVDTAAAALVGACDGELSVRRILDALEQLDVAVPDGPDLVRDLVRDGFLDLGPAPVQTSPAP